MTTRTLSIFLFSELRLLSYKPIEYGQLWFFIWLSRVEACVWNHVALGSLTPRQQLLCKTAERKNGHPLQDWMLLTLQSFYKDRSRSSALFTDYDYSSFTYSPPPSHTLFPVLYTVDTYFIDIVHINFPAVLVPAIQWLISWYLWYS